MNIEQLQLVQRTDTANEVLKFLSNRERISNYTNLESLRLYLIRSGINIKKEEYYKLFKELDEVGAGKILEHNNDPRGKFIWYYSLRSISDQILNPNKKVIIEPLVKEESKRGRRRGRPTGFSPRPKSRLPVPVKAENDVIFILNTELAGMVPLKLKEADNLVQQLQAIKAKLA